ncbi:hypothetical protein ZIOFF_067130 [Zingiber officinale]|uniref:Uncharacterized protein n=2 Tax=Zingiber officinale TaxID=94328 RepID=A0A8J5C5W9_ZINOF|nr:hypothetical protein ZIOFF_067130 [Zingiber officinale]
MAASSMPYLESVVAAARTTSTLAGATESHPLCPSTDADHQVRPSATVACALASRFVSSSHSQSLLRPIIQFLRDIQREHDGLVDLVMAFALVSPFPELILDLSLHAGFFERLATRSLDHRLVQLPTSLWEHDVFSLLGGDDQHLDPILLELVGNTPEGMTSKMCQGKNTETRIADCIQRIKEDVVEASAESKRTMTLMEEFGWQEEEKDALRAPDKVVCRGACDAEASVVKESDTAGRAKWRNGGAVGPPLERINFVARLRFTRWRLSAVKATQSTSKHNHVINQRGEMYGRGQRNAQSEAQSSRRAGLLFGPACEAVGIFRRTDRTRQGNISIPYPHALVHAVVCHQKAASWACWGSSAYRALMPDFTPRLSSSISNSDWYSDTIIATCYLENQYSLLLSLEELLSVHATSSRACTMSEVFSDLRGLSIGVGGYMDRDTDFIPSSPSFSSLSSSDLDTESTSSFFPDRSTTLGTLMGVSFAATVSASRSARLPSRREHASGGAAARRPKPRAAERRRRRGRKGSWWRLCRDEMSGPTSLGEFLQVERRMAGGDVADGHYVFGGAAASAAAEHVAVGGGPLFADGVVLPPAPPAVRQRRTESMGRLPALLIPGICSGGEG